MFLLIKYLLKLLYCFAFQDVISEIKRIASFLDKSFTDDQLKVLAHHVSFQEMANNPSVNYGHWDDLGMRHKNECKFYRSGMKLTLVIYLFI